MTVHYVYINNLVVFSLVLHCDLVKSSSAWFHIRHIIIAKTTWQKRGVY